MQKETWYEDLREMREDDEILQTELADLKGSMSPYHRSLVEGVHVYPSRSCTYTLDKARVFVRMRDDAGELLPSCALRHVILHELAHITNRGSVGHDSDFWAWLRSLATGVDQCPEKIPVRFNSCH